MLAEIAPVDPNPFGAGLATRDERLAIIQELTAFALDVDAEFLANARQLTPDPAYSLDHARLIGFAERVESLHADVLAAAQADDFVQLMLLQVTLVAEGRTFRATTSAASCELFGIGGPPSGTEGTAPSDAYGAALFDLLRDFWLRSEPEGIEPWNSLMTDQETTSVLGTLAEQRRLAASSMVASLEELAPGASQADDHTVLLSVLAAQAEIERGLVEAYAAGTLGVLAPDGPEVEAWTANVCRLGTELSEDGRALVMSATPVSPAGRPPPDTPPDPFAPIGECLAVTSAG